MPLLFPVFLTVLPFVFRFQVVHIAAAFVKLACGSAGYLRAAVVAAKLSQLADAGY
jgi:hypothetical protein